MDRRTFLAALLATGLSAPALRAAQPGSGLTVHDQPRPLPQLDIVDEEGKSIGAAPWRGRPALINLWASWCPPCVAELPSLDRLKPLIEAEGLAVVALSLDRGGAATARRTFDRLSIRNLPVLVDASRQAAATLDTNVLPTTLLVNASGAEVARYVGGAAWDGPAALALLRALIKGERPGIKGEGPADTPGRA